MTDQSHEPSHHGVDGTTSRQYPNETLRLLMERASCRSFLEKPIPDDVLQAILEAGIHSATGGNLQPYSIIKITDAATKQELDKLCGDQVFVATAPVDLLFCIDFHRLQRWAQLKKAPFAANRSFRHFWISFQDTIIAAQSICTAADALGLGSVYVGTVLECMRELRVMFKLPDGVFPVVLLSLGYPKAYPSPKKKLGTSTVVHNGQYRDLPDGELLAAFEAKYPEWKKEVTAQRLATFERVCRALYGEEYARECLEDVKANGHFNAVQNYFGLHYQADFMVDRNADFLQIAEEFGFGWFKP
jgi:FMN reductase [NAD(P)H]